MVVGIDEGSKSSDHVENEYEIQNVETTGLDNVGQNNAVKKHNDTLTLRFITKSNMIKIFILQKRKQGTAVNSQQKSN